MAVMTVCVWGVQRNLIFRFRRCRIRFGVHFSVQLWDGLLELYGETGLSDLQELAHSYAVPFTCNRGSQMNQKRSSKAKRPMVVAPQSVRDARKQTRSVIHMRFLDLARMSANCRGPQLTASSGSRSRSHTV